MAGKRLFIAINLPEKVKADLENIIRVLEKRGDPIRFEKTEKMHITLKFLGFASETKNPELRTKLKIISKKCSRFYLRLLKIEYFSGGHFVLYVGVKGETDVLEDIREGVETAFAEMGFPKERQEFTPHITIGRGKGRQPVSVWKKIGEKLVKIKLPEYETFMVESIDLMESKLTKEGSEYKIVQSFEFSRDKSENLRVQNQVKS